jgi:hypothetical protein
MTGIHVNADTFARAETDRMFTAIATEAGGVNRLNHARVPTPLDHQPVIRLNRDTLYSSADDRPLRHRRRGRRHPDARRPG